MSTRSHTTKRQPGPTLETLERRLLFAADIVASDPNDWPMYNHDAEGTRYNLAERVLSPASVGNLKVKWSFQTAGPIAGTPAVVNDRVYAADATGVVYALDRGGKLLWHTALDVGSTFSSVKLTASALVTNNTLVIGDLSGRIHGLDARTGAVRWTVRPNSNAYAAIWSSPTMVGRYVAVGVSSVEEYVAGITPGFVPTFRGSLVLLDPATGQVIWQTYTISAAESAGGASGSPIWSSPTYDRASNTIFATTGNNYTQPTTGASDAFIAFDASTGAIKWVNQRTASDEWTFVFGDGSAEHPDFDIGDSPQVYRIGGGRKVVGAGQKSGFYHVLDAATGAVVGAPIQLAPAGPVGGLFSDSACADGVVYANGLEWPHANTGGPPVRGILCAAMADGSRELWYFDTPFSPNLSGVAVANGVVYFQSAAGTFYALDAKTGSVLAQLSTNSQSSGPAVSRGQIYLGTGDAAGPFIDPTASLNPGAIVALGITDDALDSAVRPPATVLRDAVLNNPSIAKDIFQERSVLSEI